MSKYRYEFGGYVRNTETDAVFRPFEPGKEADAFQVWYKDNQPDPTDPAPLPQVESLKATLVAKGVIAKSDLPK